MTRLPGGVQRNRTEAPAAPRKIYLDTETCRRITDAPNRNADLAILVLSRQPGPRAVAENAEQMHEVGRTREGDVL